MRVRKENSYDGCEDGNRNMEDSINGGVEGFIGDKSSVNVKKFGVFSSDGE